LPLFVEQNINAKAPLKFKRRLEVEISKIQAHYTKNTVNYGIHKCQVDSNETFQRRIPQSHTVL
jgi:hypothetical protein